MNKIIVLSVLVLSLCVGSAYAADKAAGKAKYTVCASCHGPAGKSPNPLFPKLDGQHAAYLVSALKSYKANERSGPNAAQMLPFAAMLSETDMQNIAAYLASQ